MRVWMCLRSFFSLFLPVCFYLEEGGRRMEEDGRKGMHRAEAHAVSNKHHHGNNINNNKKEERRKKKTNKRTKDLGRRRNNVGTVCLS